MASGADSEKMSKLLAAELESLVSLGDNVTESEIAQVRSKIIEKIDVSDCRKHFHDTFPEVFS
jgi:hypothetical protein